VEVPFGASHMGLLLKSPQRDMDARWKQAGGASALIAKRTVQQSICKASNFTALCVCVCVGDMHGKKKSAGGTELVVDHVVSQHYYIIEETIFFGARAGTHYTVAWLTIATSSLRSSLWTSCLRASQSQVLDERCLHIVISTRASQMSRHSHNNSAIKEFRGGKLQNVKTT